MHSGLQRDQNEFVPAPNPLSWVGQGKQEVPGNTKESKLSPEEPFDPSYGMLRTLGTAMDRQTFTGLSEAAS